MLHKIAALATFGVALAVALALLLLLMVATSRAPAQECCPISDMIAEWGTPPLLAPPPAEPLPYLYRTELPIIGRYPIYPYNPVYRGRLYTFTGYIVNGVPVYRQLP